MKYSCDSVYDGPPGRLCYNQHMSPEVNELSKSEMTSSVVIELYNLLGNNEVKIWVEGGWGVDALLEKQSRPHNDLDIAVQGKDLSNMNDLLRAQGYKEKGEEHARPWNFVLIDEAGREIDVHVIDIDESGNGIYGPVENGVYYPASALTGAGIIDGCKVQCISPGDMVKFHSGYDLREKDYHDVSALCEKFGIDLPEEYKRFTN